MSSCIKLNFFCNKIIGFAPEEIQEFIDYNGHLKIISLLVKRVPLPNFYEDILSVISFNKWKNEKENYNLKNMFHTYFVACFENDKKCIIEKTEIVNITSVLTQDTALTESYDINLVRPITLYDFVHNTIDKVGEERFYVYDNIKQNCQVFCTDILRANGILTEELNSFIMQDVEKLFAELGSSVDNVIDGSTTLASVYQRVKQKML